MSHKIRRILPRRIIAEQLVSMTNTDLLHAGSSKAEAKRVADPSNPDHVRVQQNKLFRHPGRYLGAFAGRQTFGGQILGKPILEGVVKFNEWNKADQQPYETDEKQERLQQEIDAGRHRLPGRPLGIFALLTSGVLAPKRRLEVADDLMGAVVGKADGREMRIGLAENDPLTSVLVGQGFEPTGVEGDFYGITHQLYVRPGANTAEDN